MILKRIKLDIPMVGETNCYIIQDEETKETMVIDPGGEVDKISEMLDALHANVKYIVLTHCHGDHISGVKELREKYGGKILIHIEEEPGLEDPAINLSDYIGVGNISLEADSRLNDNDLIHIGDIEFKIIHTPGHTKGGICLYQDDKKILFSGDTIFKGSWGRTDLPTGNFANIIKSITDKIMVLPEDTIIYPGHRKTNHDKRRRTNIFRITTKRILNEENYFKTI